VRLHEMKTKYFFGEFFCVSHSWTPHCLHHMTRGFMQLAEQLQINQSINQE